MTVLSKKKTKKKGLTIRFQDSFEESDIESIEIHEEDFSGPKSGDDSEFEFDF